MGGTRETTRQPAPEGRRIEVPVCNSDRWATIVSMAASRTPAGIPIRQAESVGPGLILKEWRPFDASLARIDKRAHSVVRASPPCWATCRVCRRRWRRRRSRLMMLPSITPSVGSTAPVAGDLMWSGPSLSTVSVGIMFLCMFVSVACPVVVVCQSQLPRDHTPLPCSSAGIHACVARRPSAGCLIPWLLLAPLAPFLPHPLSVPPPTPTPLPPPPSPHS